MEYIFPKMAIVIYTAIGIMILGVLMLLGISWGKKGPLNYIIGSIVSIAIGIFLLYLAKGGRLTIENHTVKLKVPMFSEKVFTAEQVAQAKIISLDQDSPYLPVKKKSGGSFKNFKNGWFVLKNGEKAFLLLQGRQALYIKTTDNRTFLIGIQDFDRLLDVFQQQIGTIASS